MKLPITILALLLTTCSLFSQNIWHVNIASSAPFPNGASWNTAFPDLHDALNAAQPGDEIWVAQGVYKPSDGSDRMAHFVLPSGVGVYGGFVGTETMREARDWAANPTILSGDIGIPGDSTDNSLTIMYAFEPNDQTLLDGLVFEYGNADGLDAVPDLDSPLRSGAAVYVDRKAAMTPAIFNVRHCSFRRNHARYFGAGLFVNGLEGQVGLVLEQCVFEKNVAGLFGGGLALDNYAPQQKTVEITDCIFRENEAGQFGGGAWVRHHAAVRVAGCSFHKNISGLQGGGIAIETYISAYPRTFEHCDFTENSLLSSAFGSGLVIRSDIFQMPGSYVLNISNCRFYANVQAAIATLDNKHTVYINQCLFHSNISYISTDRTPSVAMLDGTDNMDDCIFNNCIFYRNWNYEFSIYSDSVQLNNCILIDRQEDAYTSAFRISRGFTLNNCIVSHSTCDDLKYYIFGHPATCNNVQFATDPLFIAPGDSLTADFHLQPCSPAINAGLNTVVDSFGISTDFDGNPRVRNGRVDIGPYETNVFLSPDILTTPSCVGASDGAFSLNGNICTPYSLVWDNGNTTGTTLSGLPAGTYSLSITDANDLTIQETVVVPAQDSLILSANIYNVACAGEHTGYVQLSTSGGSPFPGIPPYEYAANNPPTIDLATGMYAYTVSDANGCTATVSASVTEPPPYIVYYTVKNASGAMQADGAIYFDSTSWGLGVPLNDIFNLLPNTYHFTITDAQGCLHAFSVVVGYTSAISSPLESPCRIYPNPGYADTPFYIETNGKEGFVAKVYDQQGRLLRQQTFAPGGGKLDATGLLAGIYQVEIRSNSGVFGRLGLQILGQ